MKINDTSGIIKEINETFHGKKVRALGHSIGLNISHDWGHENAGMFQKVLQAKSCMIMKIDTQLFFIDFFRRGPKGVFFGYYGPFKSFEGFGAICFEEVVG